MTKNEIFLRKKLKVFIPNSAQEKIDLFDNETLIATLLANIGSLGYIFSRKLYNKLIVCNKKELENFSKEIIKVLKKIRGAHVRYEPMYPNFPEQVMKADELELFLNAYFHYLSAFLSDIGISNNIYMPNYSKKRRGVFNEDIKYQMIDIGTENQYKDIFKDLVSSKTSLSDLDKEIISCFFDQYKKDISELLPAFWTIGLKENIIFVCKEIMKSKEIFESEKIKMITPYINTPTDVLRFCVALSNGDISLAEKTFFRNFKRSERRLILSILDKCKTNIVQEMSSRKMQWIRLGEKLHPGDYCQFERSYFAFSEIRNQKTHTFLGNVNIQLNNDFISGLNLLKSHPGELARRLDFLLRTNNDKVNDIINSFKTVCEDVSTNVLLQIHCHFKNRNDKGELNIALPKGSIAKSFVYIDNRLTISEDICKKIVLIIEKALIKRFKNAFKNANYNLNETFLSEDLKGIYIPFSNRSSSSSMLQLNRGSKFPLEKDKDIIRFFIHWKNNNNRADVDLSADILDENFDYKRSIAFYNLRKNGAVHSGDITDAPNGAAEFIDIDISKFSDYSYVAMNVYSFTGQKFSEINECFVGFMQRKEGRAGKIFEPKTVKNCIELKANAVSLMPLLIDIKNRKVVWIDLPVTKHSAYSTKKNSKQTTNICKLIFETKRPNLYDLLYLHIKANGSFAKNKSEAKLKFTLDNLNINEITNKYL